MIPTSSPTPYPTSLTCANDFRYDGMFLLYFGETVLRQLILSFFPFSYWVVSVSSPFGSQVPGADRLAKE